MRQYCLLSERKDLAHFGLFKSSMDAVGGRPLRLLSLFPLRRGVIFCASSDFGYNVIFVLKMLCAACIGKFFERGAYFITQIALAF